MSGLHGILGLLAVAAAVVVAIAAGVTSVGMAGPRGRSLARLTEILAGAATVLVFVALFVGGLLLVSGLRPSSPVHLILAVAALLALPAAAGIGLWSEQGAGRSPLRYRWLAGGAVVTAVLALLLAMTG
jgi:hypothetical protein